MEYQLFITRKKLLINLMIIDKENSYFKAILNLIGAGLAMTIANPVQLVRIRMQTSTQLVSIGTLNKSYSGIIDCSRRVLCQEGMRAFWKGNYAKLVRFYCSETINFFSKQLIRNYLKKNTKTSQKTDFIKNTFSGVIGSWVSLSILYPIQHARNCLSNSIGQNKNTILSSIKGTIQKGGVRALYLGSSVSLVGVAVFRGTNFGIFDTYKNKMEGFYRWLLAYFSSSLAILLTYPSDTVRRRMICAQNCNKKYSGFFDCLVKIYQNEGLKSFYRGGPVIFAQSISSSIVLYSYDKIGREIIDPKRKAD